MAEKIPYEKFLAASVLEEAVFIISQSEYGDAFWLKKTNYFLNNHFETSVDLNLEFVIKENERIRYQKEEFSKVFSEIFRNRRNDYNSNDVEKLRNSKIYWNYLLKEEHSSIHMNLTGTVESVKVPLKITFHRLQDEKMKPKVVEMMFVTKEDVRVKLNFFPCEQVIVENFLEIISKLELINYMGAYYRIYELLISESISGRQVWEMLNDVCREQRIVFEKKRYEMLMSYKDSSYMKKKWKVFLRHEKRKEPEWEHMMEIMEHFFEKIWDHLCKNVIYLGDWMPELGRFID